ncbi:sigma-70_family RNA polymerase sigma factor [Hexamita inflata]|uniref:Sigma-70 family RNA polymerase sigma factor n=1 Tax=Hexamita inflata TaxID=28002 RepID=A0AA86TFY2_9EUKA|nr:sigma-70 family RNA polymerase sigma factor [Hexamita inflata]
MFACSIHVIKSESLSNYNDKSNCLIQLTRINLTDLESLQQFKQLKKFESINNTQLTSIKQVYSLTNLLSLTINNTYINNLVGIKQLSKLQYIDLRDNYIVSVEPVKSLQYLKQVLIDNNFIQDLEHLTTTKNYNPEWIYFQNAITDSELARYLNDTQLKCTLLELKTSFEGKKRRTDELIRDYPAAYDAKMKAKYQYSVKGGSQNGFGPELSISNDPEIRDLRFVSELGVTDLYLDSCQNAHLLRAPANLRRLIHFPSGMKTAKGVERLVELEVLCIVQTQIVELNIRGLQKLKTLDCRNNNIMDMSAAEYLKAKGCCKERYLIDDQQQPSQQEIDEARLW